MTKREYTMKQIAKTNKKNYENYVVTRIYHRLNRNDVKFITQQYVNRPSGHALTDMFFPQLKLHLEIDEPFHKMQEKLDIDRETDIVKATNHEFFRIKITEDLEEINEQVENFVRLINNKIESCEMNQSWEPWDFEKEFQPSYYEKIGYLDVNENPAFRKIIDACNCLGQNYHAVQRGWFKSKIYPNHYLWFPKFYENEEWDNRISDDGKVITEKCKNPDKYDAWFKGVFSHNVRRIVFPRSIDNLGFKLYRFAGIFETDFENSSFENGVIHRLVDVRIDIKVLSNKE
jgi:very-short-patch-repair endonuclease